MFQKKPLLGVRGAVALSAAILTTLGGVALAAPTISFADDTSTSQATAASSPSPGDDQGKKDDSGKPGDDQKAKDDPTTSAAPESTPTADKGDDQGKKDDSGKPGDDQKAKDDPTTSAAPESTGPVDPPSPAAPGPAPKVVAAVVDLTITAQCDNPSFPGVPGVDVKNNGSDTVGFNSITVNGTPVAEGGTIAAGATKWYPVDSAASSYSVVVYLVGDETVSKTVSDVCSPADPDADGDGYTDAEEKAAGSDPSDPKSTPVDLDGDGVLNKSDKCPNTAAGAEVDKKGCSADQQNPPGNNGTLKIHELGTPSGTESNDPKVCTFNLEGFGFDTGQTGYVMFDVQGGDGPTGTPAGPYSVGPASAAGYFETQYFNLANGHYKATLYGKMLPSGQLEDEKAKSKVFKVACEVPPPPVYVVPDKPTKVDLCEPADGTVVDGVNIIADEEFGSYTIDGKPAVAGFNPVAGTSAKVVFVPKKGVEIKEGADSEWTFEFTKVACEVPPVEKVATVPTSQDKCEPAEGTNDTVTIPADEFFVYKLDGVEKAAGTYLVTGTSATVTAQAKDGFTPKPDSKTEWTFEFTKVACEVPPVEITVTAPAFTKSTCTKLAVVTVEDTEFYTWMVSGPNSAKVYTAVLWPEVEGVTLVGQTSWTFDLSKKTGEKCDSGRGKESKTDPVVFTLPIGTAAGLAGLLGLMASGAVYLVVRGRRTRRTNLA